MHVHSIDSTFGDQHESNKASRFEPGSNGDGKVSLKEFMALGGLEESFRAMDSNSDNSLSNAEFGAAGMSMEPKTKP